MDRGERVRPPALLWRFVIMVFFGEGHRWNYLVVCYVHASDETGEADLYLHLSAFESTCLWCRFSSMRVRWSERPNN